MSSFLWKQIPSDPVPAPVADENKEEISEDATSEVNNDNVNSEVTTGAAKDASTETDEQCGVCNTENEEKEEDCTDADSDDDSDDDSDETTGNTTFSVDKDVKKYIVSINDRPFYTVNTELDASKIMWNITKRLITNLNRDFSYHMRVSARGVNRLDIFSTYKLWILSYENLAHSVSYHRVYGATIDK